MNRTHRRIGAYLFFVFLAFSAGIVAAVLFKLAFGAGKDALGSLCSLVAVATFLALRDMTAVDHSGNPRP